MDVLTELPQGRADVNRIQMFLSDVSEHGARYAVDSLRPHPQISMQYTSINAAEQPPHTGQHCRTSEIDATTVGCRIVICFSFHPQCAFKG